jgi:prophage regulatory protein
MLKTCAGDIIGNMPGVRGERLVRMKELRVLTGLGRSTIHRLISEGRFPKQIHPFGNRMAAWRLSDVQQWIAHRCEGKAA